MSALTTVGPDGAALDLGQPRSVWRLAMTESGLAKLVVDQTAPGEFGGLLLLGISGYRLELTLGADRARARGKLFAGHRLDWREAVTATRGADFALAARSRPSRRRRARASRSTCPPSCPRSITGRWWSSSREAGARPAGAPRRSSSNSTASTSRAVSTWSACATSSPTTACSTRCRPRRRVPAATAAAEFRRVAAEFRANVEILLASPSAPRRANRPLR
jgi:hypothetical protein